MQTCRKNWLCATCIYTLDLPFIQMPFLMDSSLNVLSPPRNIYPKWGWDSRKDQKIDPRKLLIISTTVVISLLLLLLLSCISRVRQIFRFCIPLLLAKPCAVAWRQQFAIFRVPRRRGNCAINISTGACYAADSWRQGSLPCCIISPSLISFDCILVVLFVSSAFQY